MSHRQPRPKRRIGRWINEFILTVLAIFGVVCVGAVVAAWVFGVSIMLFRTGSMSPEIPANSVALVRTIPAAEAEVGDVVTVHREEGQMPITHRVIGNEPDPKNPPDGRIIEMQGDANPQPDPFPYRVEEVQRVFWSMPTGGEFIVSLASPWVLGAVTLVAAGIVAWAFWPAREGPDADK